MKNVLISILMLSLVLIVSCGPSIESREIKPSERPGAAEEVTLTTQDSFKIEGTYYEANSDKSLILIHQLNNDRNSWNDFARDLKSQGYNVFTIDLKGHGESSGKWQSFNIEQFNNMVFDVEEAAKFLNQKHPNAKLSVIGASIGANVAVKYGVENEVDGLVLLSPGLEYRGIKIDKDIEDLKPKILIIAGNGDRYSYESSVELKERRDRFSLSTDIKFYTSNLHGTELLGGDADNVIMDWLNKNI